MGKIAIVLLAVLATSPALAFASQTEVGINYFHGIRFFNLGDSMVFVNTDNKAHTLGGHTPTGSNFNSGEIAPNQNYTLHFDTIGDYYIFDYADSSINATYTVIGQNQTIPFVESTNNGNNQTLVFGDSNATFVYSYSNSTLVLNPSNYTVSSPSSSTTNDYSSPSVTTNTTSTNNNQLTTQTQTATTTPETQPTTTAPTASPTFSITISVNTLAKVDALRAFMGLPPLETIATIVWS